jgi:hypothetical protein
MNRNATTVIQILEKLEDFRNKLQSREITPGSEDWVVRVCESTVADFGGFKNRASWTEKLREKQFIRKRRLPQQSKSA